MKKEKTEITQDEIKINLINTFYSNGIGAGYSSDDFFITFMQYPEQGENGVNSTRIFLTPTSFKEIIIFLKERLDEYEKDFGEIELNDEKSWLKYYIDYLNTLSKPFLFFMIFLSKYIFEKFMPIFLLLMIDSI